MSPISVCRIVLLQSFQMFFFSLLGYGVIIFGPLCLIHVASQRATRYLKGSKINIFADVKTCHYSFKIHLEFDFFFLLLNHLVIRAALTKKRSPPPPPSELLLTRVNEYITNPQSLIRIFNRTNSIVSNIIKVMNEVPQS